MSRLQSLPQDVVEINRTALRYLRAQDFLTRLYRQRNRIRRDDLEQLRQQAIAGDVAGANEGLKRALEVALNGR